MYKNFDTLPGSSRIWIYQSDRTLDEEEIKSIMSSTISFLDKWQSHGKDITCSCTILHSRFLIISADEVQCVPTECCAIDASVNHIKAVENQFKINLLNRTLLIFLQDGKFFSIQLQELRRAIDSKKITASTLFFDNTIIKKSQLLDNWPSIVDSTWIGHKL